MSTYKIIALPIVDFYPEVGLTAEIILERLHNKGYKIVASNYVEKYEYDFSVVPDYLTGNTKIVTNIDKEILDLLKEQNIPLYNFERKETFPTIIYTLIRTPVGKELYEDFETPSP